MYDLIIIRSLPRNNSQQLLLARHTFPQHLASKLVDCFKSKIYSILRLPFGLQTILANAYILLTHLYFYATTKIHVQECGYRFISTHLFTQCYCTVTQDSFHSFTDSCYCSCSSYCCTISIVYITNTL